MTQSQEAPVSPNAAISRAVTLLREDRGLNVEQLAVYSGLNRASLYRKIKGEAGWKATDIATLSRFFHVQPNDLFSGTPIGGQPGDVEDVPSTVVRHQGLEPRTRWFKAGGRSMPTSRALPGCPQRLAA